MCAGVRNAADRVETRAAAPAIEKLLEGHVTIYAAHDPLGFKLGAIGERNARDAAAAGQNARNLRIGSNLDP